MNVPYPDREAAGDAGRRSESGVTVDSWSNHSWETRCNAGARLGNSSGWTNEKHNSYLDYLEASFVEQLNHPINLRCLKGRNWKPFPLLELPENSCESVDQLTVLCDGNWQKTKFGKKRTFLDTAENSNVVNWVKSTGFSYGSVRNTEKKTEHQLNNENLVCNVAEASGQNFLDEDVEKSNVAQEAKRPKRSGEADASSNDQDQVVPIGKSSKGNVPTQNFSGTDEEELLCEKPENFTSQRANLPYFLRGS